MRRLALACAALAALALAGCASVETTTTPLGDDKYTVTVKGAPDCSADDVHRTARRLAAVETIRQGYDRFGILWLRSSDSVRRTQSPVMVPRTIPYGDGKTLTTFQPLPPTVTGTRNMALGVKMFHAGDEGTQDTVDARELLGPDWEKAVEKGVSTCR